LLCEPSFWLMPEWGIHLPLSRGHWFCAMDPRS
jgi:hypothetical protein